MYLLDADATSFMTQKRALETAFPGIVSVISYPMQLFWSVVSKKRNDLYVGNGKADFEGDIPSFRHFGALVMLVPVLEVLESGYNAIFMDIDVGMIEDPIPSLVHGDSDVTTSQEIRYCNFPSLQYYTDWGLSAPNTGTIFWKASNLSVDFYRKWLGRIVFDNCLNDQWVMSLGYQSNSAWTRSCDPSSTGIKEQYVNAQSHRFKYCYLNEFKFQNGYMEKFCSKNAKESQFFRYILGMYFNSKHHNHTSSSMNNNRTIITPIIYHVNYCPVKHKCLDEKGLWLYHRHERHQYLSHLGGLERSIETHCRPFNIFKTNYAQIDWATHLQAALDAYHSALQTVSEDSLVKFPTDGTIFLVENRHLRPIPSAQVFFAFNFSFDKVSVMKDPLLVFMPIGKELSIPSG